jgi:ACS family hexuronate transporter-like MFS transporter
MRERKVADTTSYGDGTKSDESSEPTVAPPPSAGLGRVRWTVCAMLFAATSINYMDRQVIAILKPTLEHSIGLTEINYGYIVDAFQIAYAIGLLAAGRLIDKLGTRIGYMVVMAVWSVSAMGHALASTALEFGMARFCLGLGESGNFPAAIKTIAEWFPQNERALATGLFNSGANVGAILAPLIVPWVTLRYGWHIAFLTTGLFSALWILWWYLRYRRPGRHASLVVQEPRQEVGRELRYVYREAAIEMGPAVPWRRLLGFRQTWAFAMAKFLTDPIWYFYLFWLPSYFSDKFNLNLSHLGLPLIIVYNVSAIGSVGGGWLPSPFRRMGFSPNGARLTAMLACACLVVPIYTATSVRSVWTAIALISLAAGAHQGWSANLFTTASDMFPGSAVGSVVGIGGMAGSAGSALFAFFAGHVLQLTHSYTSLFAIAASAYLLALAILYWLAPGLKKVELADATWVS